MELVDDPNHVTFYVPCHFDQSQVESIAPFLEDWGGKIFMYQWHPSSSKMLKYWKENFPKLEIETFSVESLVKSLVNETRKVIFLLTASLAPEFAFGRLQVKLFTLLKQAFPEVIADVAAIGHCMYGCYSCSSSQHKIPLYFTRFFRGTLPYQLSDIQALYFHTNGKEKFVLVAPSTGETSLMQHKHLLEKMLQLQQAGTHRFVFKLHPSAFVEKSYDMDDEVDNREWKSLTFVRENFVVVDEKYHCILPFLQGAEIIICDLQSTVPFAALYFSPKVVCSFRAPDDVNRHYDENYLANLNLWTSSIELEALLTNPPPPKGEKAFFHFQYGEVDGKEHLKYAKLSNWPTGEDCNVTLKPVNFDKVVSNIKTSWDKVLKEAQQDPDKGVLKDCLYAMGLTIPKFGDEQGAGLVT